MKLVEREGVFLAKKLVPQKEHPERVNKVIEVVFDTSTNKEFTIHKIMRYYAAEEEFEKFSKKPYEKCVVQFTNYKDDKKDQFVINILGVK